MKKDISLITLYLLLIILMLWIIPFIKNDYFLSIIYTAIIIIAITIKKERADLLILAVGFFGTLIGEYFFINAGVETFNRTSFLGIMPLWLPLLWGFIFLAIKRVFWTLVKEYL